MSVIISKVIDEDKNLGSLKEYKCTDNYIFYEAMKLLNSKGNMKTNVFVTEMNEIYNGKLISKELKALCFPLYYSDKRDYSIKNYDILLNRITEIEECFSDFKNKAEAEIEGIVVSKMISAQNSIEPKTEFQRLLHLLKNKYYDENVIIAFALYCDFKVTNKSFDEYIDRIVHFLMNVETLAIELKKYYKEIDARFINVDISKLYKNEKILNVMYKYGLSDINSMINLDFKKILAFNVLNMNSFLINVFSLNQNFMNYVPLKVENMLLVLNESEKEVLSERQGLGKNLIERTLEDVGNEKNLTRERIRQIEKKSFEKLSKWYEEANELMEAILYFNGIENDYIMYEDLSCKFENRYHIDALCCILSNKNGNKYIFDNKLSVLFDSRYTTIEDLIESKIENIGKIAISNKEYQRLNRFEKSIIDARFTLRKNGLYQLRGSTLSELVLECIDENFAEGYHTVKDYDKLKEIFTENFPDFEFPALHSIERFVQTDVNYRLVAGGTYKNKKFCPNISENFMNEITNYILESDSITLYSAIYDKFKNLFNDIGVNSPSYVKGLIDPLLDRDVFYPNKSHVSLGNKKIFLCDTLFEFVDSQKGKFSTKDIIDAIPGIKDYTIQTYFIPRRDILMLDGRKYVNLRDVGVNDEIKEELKSIIMDIFKASGEKIISTRKIYSRLRMFHKDLLSGLKYVESSFDLYSLIYCLFENDFNMRRPYISIDSNAALNRKDIVVDFVMEKEKFDYSCIKEYLLKMNLPPVPSYLEFMDNLVDDGFIQYNVDSMVKVDKLQIDDNQLKEIEEIIELIIERNGELNTTYFNGYHLLPNLKLRWNQYLLQSIIKYYFNEKYEVFNTDKMYDKTAYIIKRIKEVIAV